MLSVRGSDLHLFRGGIFGAIGRSIYRSTDFIMPVSDDLACQLLREGVAGDKVEAVHNGVGGRFHPADKGEARRCLGLRDVSRIVLYVGLLVPAKGLDDLFDALEMVDDPKIQCVLVGGGQLLEELKARTMIGVLTKRVVFAGARSSEEIPVWMNASDVLVLPSKSEGRPNVVLEAQACGVPVVATSVGGIPELIEDGVDGILVPPGDCAALAASLKSLCADEDVRRQYGKAARRKVEERGLTWERTADRTRDIYRRVAELA